MAKPRLEEVVVRTEDIEGDEYGNIFFNLQAYVGEQRIGKGMAFLSRTDAGGERQKARYLLYLLNKGDIING